MKTGKENIRHTIGIKAMNIIQEYLSSKKYKTEDVSHDARFKGIDLICVRGKKTFTAEVKGTTKQNSIPNAYSSEFKSQVFVADYLFVVWFMKQHKYKKYCIYQISRDQLKNEGLHKKHNYVKFSSQLKHNLPTYVIEREVAVK